ncbi:hypothetical protein ACR3K2_27080 [Cryptosporidium serpentis]
MTNLNEVTNLNLCQESTKNISAENIPLEKPKLESKLLGWFKNLTQTLNRNKIKSEERDEVPVIDIRFKRVFGNSKWEKLLAIHHGIAVTETELNKTPESISDEMVEIERTILHDIGYNSSVYKSEEINPSNCSKNISSNNIENYRKNLDACRYLEIEARKCFLRNRYSINPDKAIMKCHKYQVEYIECLWDQEKVIRGISSIEVPFSKKRRPFISAPNPNSLGL